MLHLRLFHRRNAQTSGAILFTISSLLLYFSLEAWKSLITTRTVSMYPFRDHTTKAPVPESIGLYRPAPMHNSRPTKPPVITISPSSQYSRVPSGSAPNSRQSEPSKSLISISPNQMRQIQSYLVFRMNSLSFDVQFPKGYNKCIPLPLR